MNQIRSTTEDELALAEALLLFDLTHLNALKGHSRFSGHSDHLLQEQIARWRTHLSESERRLDEVGASERSSSTGASLALLRG